MIIQAILDLIKNVLFLVFGWINLPQMPEQITNAINTFLDLIFDNVGLLGLFIRIDTIKLVVPVVLIIMNFEKLYHLTLWILKKIPMLNIK